MNKRMEDSPVDDILFLEYFIHMNMWCVYFTGKARKQKDSLPEPIQEALELLYAELEADGPIRHMWPHYGKLKGKRDLFHCHLNKGHPRYVAVWKVTDNHVRILEIRYVGTHEKADYARFY